MIGPRAYLDYNASAPLLPAARDAMLSAIDLSANPSSVHAEGRAARRLVENARRDVAALVGARPEHVIFTASATEAASTLLTPDWRMGRGKVRFSKLYVCATDHPCLLNGGHFAAADVVRIGVDRNGVIDLDALGEALASHDTSDGLPLVAVHSANNETGVLQRLAGIASLTKQAGGVLVVDAVQAVGKIPVDIASTHADFLICSSHKIGGPLGAGAIVAASDVLRPAPLIVGGGQERGYRAGTENMPAIAGFGAAAASARQMAPAEVAKKRDWIERSIRRLAPEAVVFGEDVDRLPNTTFFVLPGIKAETAQIAFDLAGVALSAGSACSSGKVGPSHVLIAMGFGDVDGALRVSIGYGTTDADLDRFEAALAVMVARQGSRSRAA